MQAIPSGVPSAAFRPRRRSVAAILVVASTFGACDVAAPPLASIEFADVFRRTDEIVLQQDADYPLVSLSSFDVSETGHLVVADAPNARIHLFAPDGELEASFGVRGDGPGEFQHPAKVRFDTAGRIHVVDLQRYAITRLSPRGEFISRIGLDGDFFVQGVELRDGGYVLSGISGGAAAEVVRTVDSTGGVTGRYLPVGRHIPSGAQETLLWTSIRYIGLAVAGDTAFATSSLLDTLWTVDLVTGRTGSRPITMHGYKPPSAPGGPYPHKNEVLSWVRSQTLVAGIAGGQDLLIVPISTGLYHEQTHTPAALRDAEGRWYAISHMPMVLRARGETIWTLRWPEPEDPVIVDVYRYVGDP